MNKPKEYALMLFKASKNFVSAKYLQALGEAGNRTQ